MNTDQLASEAAEAWGRDEGWPDSSDIAAMAKRIKAAIEKAFAAKREKAEQEKNTRLSDGKQRAPVEGNIDWHNPQDSTIE